MTTITRREDTFRKIDRLLEKKASDAMTHLKALQKAFEEEPVHDFRVSIRRLNALLDLLERLMEKEAPGGKASRKTKTNRKRFKKKLGSFGSLRDLQVFKTELAQALPQAPGLLPLYEHLVVREHVEMEKARKRSGKLKPEVFPQALDQIRKELAEAFGGEIDPRSLDMLLDQSSASLNDKIQALDLKQAESFHTLRIAVKKFRYAMEIRSQVVDKLPEDVFKTLKTHQDLLGRIQDITVMTGIIDTYGKTRPVPFELNLYYNHLEDIQCRLMNEAFSRLPELGTLWPPA